MPTISPLGRSGGRPTTFRFVDCSEQKAAAETKSVDRPGARGA